jgi:hypothetical protein
MLIFSHQQSRHQIGSKPKCKKPRLCIKKKEIFHDSYFCFCCYFCFLLYVVSKSLKNDDENETKEKKIGIYIYMYLFSCAISCGFSFLRSGVFLYFTDAICMYKNFAFFFSLLVLLFLFFFCFVLVTILFPWTDNDEYERNVMKYET